MTLVSNKLLDLRLECDRRINFAMQQNDVPVIKALHIENATGTLVRDLEVRIAAEPAFTREWSARITSLPSVGVYTLGAVDLQLSPGFLGELTERVRGQLRVEVRQGEEVLAQEAVSVDLLARDEWGGLSSLPEILAAFVLPNHPVVDRVLRAAADSLSHATRDPSLDGYQRQSTQRVLAVTAAVYASLQQLGLTYVNPPASFEDEGQRVRLPDRIAESRMATCLDVALLAAACLEQAGLNTLVVLVRGHAFTGVWLQDECFPEPAIDDGLRLRKRVDLGEIAVFDPTGVTTRPSVPFDQAITEAKRRLDPLETFVCAIDVRRARKGRIRPLPERVARPEGLTGQQPVGAEGLPLAIPSMPAIAEDKAVSQEHDPGKETSTTRLARWRRKLLDLSLRNHLLNFRETKKTLTLQCPDLGQLEDMLASGATFRIMARPTDLSGNDPRDPAAHRRRTGQEAMAELLRDELKARRLYADTTPQDLERRMIEIYRAARLGLEEGGASALYLTLGSLLWYETDKSEQQRRAPILLLPLELHRNSVREGFSLRLADDEPRINVTLLELLKKDFGLTISGLDPLPEDESGLNVPKILHIVRRAVRDIERWDVEEDARIGFFSFSKFLMWRDLDARADDLMKSPVVEHLVNRPNQPFDAKSQFPDPDRLDKERAPTDTFCPLPADSSQLAAVFAAADGRSFVLEGPPGTGKSQTITNLIAHCLTEGKTVLFVSEKMAALDVVHRRLSNIGLGRFCLELHSNGANKREVILQLNEALQRLQVQGHEDWEREARRLASLRNELNAYAQALHEKRSTGESIFEATSRLIGLRDIPRVDLRWPSPDAFNRDSLAALRDLVERFATVGTNCGEISGNPWEGVRRAEWTPGWEDEVRQAIADLSDASEVLAERTANCAGRLGLPENGSSLNDLDLLKKVTVSLMASPAPPTALLIRPDWEEIQNQLGTWIERGRSRDRLRAEMQKHFRPDIMKLDLDDLSTRLEQATGSWWPASWWRRRPVRNALKRVALDGKAPSNDVLPNILTRGLDLREEQRKLDAASDEARMLLGRYWNDAEAEWDGIAQVRDWAHQLRALARQIAGDDFERGTKLREKWARLASEVADLLRPDGSIGREFVAFGEAVDRFKESRTRVAELLDLDAQRIWGSDATADAVGRVRSSVTAWRPALGQLRNWCAWRRSRTEAMEKNVTPLVEAFETGTIRSDQLQVVFERSYAQWWVDSITDREPVLSQFFSPEHERKISQFRLADERYMQLTRQLIQARLGQRVPSASASILPNSEMGILKREVNKKRRHMSVRQLLQKIPNLLPRLKPCLLMSPMSVAQYLEADYPPFDVVVFDEASQIPVWDAIGAIARGRQAVIVGDPKQLPPTSFFQRADDDDDAVDDEGVEDLESILDECIGAQIPWLPLTWHYRSRHESLITFSNYHYYDKRLLTFPSPALEGLGVSWRHVPNGVYDKGKSRTNRAEADAVVHEILRRLRSPDLSQYSIGVVTFSQAQQTLIEDLLETERGKDPDLEPYFAEDRYEPVFIKNLENVQGDERDVILFSICYGPDSNGRVSMNFGPMNREGGERRLNVAITRARREVMVFSTLKAEQINLARTRARGVKDLKGFLEFAERGPAAIAAAILPDADADFESPFEKAVSDALVQRGWTVHRQVGCARYRIDLAVVDPEAPGRYLLGIECDGANYHSAKTARDRDKLREGILRDLGWRLHRVWSTDWWRDPEREIRKLEEALARAREQGPDAAPTEVAPTDPAKSSAPIESFASTQPAPATTSAIEPAHPPLKRYRPTKVGTAIGSQAEFYEPRSVAAIRQRLIEVVRQEGPISLALAARRVAAYWGFERVRTPALDRIRALIPQGEVSLQVVDGEEFLWPKGADPDSYTSFRVPEDNGDGARQADELPLEEIGNAVVHILEHHMSGPLEELVRETARLFGFQRVGRVVDDRIRKAIARLEKRGIARVEAGSVRLG